MWREAVCGWMLPHDTGDPLYYLGDVAKIEFFFIPNYYFFIFKNSLIMKNHWERFSNYSQDNWRQMRDFQASYNLLNCFFRLQLNL